MDRKLLILDLDETLIFASETPLHIPPDFNTGKYHVYKRPHLEKFLTFACGQFEVAVWTSSSQAYAEIVVPNVFAEDFPLSFVWDERRCTKVSDSENWRHYYVKDLKKVKRRGYRLESVIMIDDTPEKLVRQHGNHLRLEAFMGDPEDSELRDVQPFLRYLSEQENIRRIEKRGWRNLNAAGKGV